MYKRLLPSTLLLAATAALHAQPDAFINEIDYDTPGSDANEFLEVAIDLSSCGATPCDPADFDVVVYNGTGVVRSTTAVPAVATDTDGPYSLFVIGYGGGGLQNEDEGIALVYNGGASPTVIEFISYEGVVTAVDGPAAGTSSTDVGVRDGNGSPNLSIQRRPDGSYELAAPTEGAPNATPVPVSLISFDISAAGSAAELTWATASERDNAGFRVEVSRDGERFGEVGYVAGAGTLDQRRDYRFAYRATAPGRHYFRLAQTDFDGQVTYSPTLTGELGTADRAIRLASVTADEVGFDLEAGGEVRIVDLRGATVFSARLDAGRRAIDVSALAAGVYVLTDGHSAVRFVLR